MLELITKDPHAHQSILDELARQGARQILTQALKLEADEYVARHVKSVDEEGHRMVVRNGKAKNRTISIGAGQIELQAPRINDKRDGNKFESLILPKYVRKSPNIESLIPILYLKGLSTNDFSTALESILGEGAKGLSPASIVSLKKAWEKELEEWNRRPITDQFIYIFADGVNVKVRLGEDKKICLLVIVGVKEDGEKALIAVSPGYRESTESWKMVLESLVSRGLKSPLLAIADGALGFWSAMRETDGFRITKEQRCWVHKIANVLDCFPKRLQPQVKTLLHEMMYSNSKQDAKNTKERFNNLFFEKYPKAVEKLEKNWDELVTFFSFPGSHWSHLRTTNVIESAFATVKLRTKVTKGAGSPQTAAAMGFKLLLEAEKNWRKIKGSSEIKNLLQGIVYRDGVMLRQGTNQESVA